MAILKKILLCLMLFAFISTPMAMAESGGSLVSTTPRIVQKGAINVIGTSNTYGMTATYAKMFKQWAAFLNQDSAVANQASSKDYIGVSIAKSWTKFDYITGMAVNNTSNVPANMASTTVPASKYAVFTYKGALNNYQKETDRILDKYLKQNKLKWNQKAPLLEVFKAGKFTPDNMNSANNEVEIYVPLKN